MAKTYGTVTTFTAGSVLTAAQMNVAGGAINNLVVPPGVRLVRSSTLSYTTGTDIAFTSPAAYDTDGMFSVGSPTRITIQTPGIYVVTATVFVTFTGTLTSSNFKLMLNGGAAAENDWYGSRATDFVTNLSHTASFSAADYLTVQVALGGATSPVVQTALTGFTATWIGRTS